MTTNTASFLSEGNSFYMTTNTASFLSEGNSFLIQPTL
jgi:hypothetical protein